MDHPADTPQLHTAVQPKSTLAVHCPLLRILTKTRSTEPELYCNILTVGAGSFPGRQLLARLPLLPLLAGDALHCNGPLQPTYLSIFTLIVFSHQYDRVAAHRTVFVHCRLAQLPEILWAIGSRHCCCCDSMILTAQSRLQHRPVLCHRFENNLELNSVSNIGLETTGAKDRSVIDEAAINFTNCDIWF